MENVFEEISGFHVVPKTKSIKKVKKMKRSAVVERIKCMRDKKNQKNQKNQKKTATMTVNIPSYILSQWIELMSGKPKTMPPNCIPMLYCKKDDYSPWIYTMITSVYRKRKDWYKLIEDIWKKPFLIDSKNPDALKHHNPFYYSRQIAIHLDKLMCLNITLHMNILRCVQRRLLAKMDLRVVGEDDLHTTTRIPATAIVAVYDFKTRAKYVFHTNTILKMILSSLKYCTYGIANPKPPKNPYTNLEWTNPQLMSITQQIVCNMASLHRIPPPLFLNYYNCNYDIPLFTKFCEKELGINAAVELFKMKDDSETRDIYGETIDDIVEYLEMIISSRLRSMVVDRKLPASLQERWDSVILALWIYTNIRVLYNNYDSYDTLLEDFKKIYSETREYIFQLSRASRRPRPTAIALPCTYALSILIDAAIYTDNVLEVTDEDVPLTVNL